MNNNYNKIPDNSPDFMDIDKMSKHGHFDLIRKRYGVRYEDILSFDDDKKYYDKAGLGPAENVTVAGVLTSNNIAEQGIRMSLFKTGIAYYVFDRINQIS